jgi:hypothetical protein
MVQLPERLPPRPESELTPELKVALAAATQEFVQNPENGIPRTEEGNQLGARTIFHAYQRGLSMLHGAPKPSTPFEIKQCVQWGLKALKADRKAVLSQAEAVVQHVPYIGLSGQKFSQEIQRSKSSPLYDELTSLKNSLPPIERRFQLLEKLAQYYLSQIVSLTGLVNAGDQRELMKGPKQQAQLMSGLLLSLFARRYRIACSPLMVRDEQLSTVLPFLTEETADQQMAETAEAAALMLEPDQELQATAVSLLKSLGKQLLADLRRWSAVRETPEVAANPDLYWKQRRSILRNIPVEAYEYKMSTLHDSRTVTPELLDLGDHVWKNTVVMSGWAIPSPSDLQDTILQLQKGGFLPSDPVMERLTEAQAALLSHLTPLKKKIKRRQRLEKSQVEYSEKLAGMPPVDVPAAAEIAVLRAQLKTARIMSKQHENARETIQNLATKAAQFESEQALFLHEMLAYFRERIQNDLRLASISHRASISAFSATASGTLSLGIMVPGIEQASWETISRQIEGALADLERIKNNRKKANTSDRIPNLVEVLKSFLLKEAEQTNTRLYVGRGLGKTERYSLTSYQSRIRKALDRITSESDNRMGIRLLASKLIKELYEVKQIMASQSENDLLKSAQQLLANDPEAYFRNPEIKRN